MKKRTRLSFCKDIFIIYFVFQFFTILTNCDQNLNKKEEDNNNTNSLIIFELVKTPSSNSRSLSSVGSSRLLWGEWDSGLTLKLKIPFLRDEIHWEIPTGTSFYYGISLGLLVLGFKVLFPVLLLLKFFFFGDHIRHYLWQYLSLPDPELDQFTFFRPENIHNIERDFNVKNKEIPNLKKKKDDENEIGRKNDNFSSNKFNQITPPDAQSNKNHNYFLPLNQVIFPSQNLFMQPPTPKTQKNHKLNNNIYGPFSKLLTTNYDKVNVFEPHKKSHTIHYEYPLPVLPIYPTNPTAYHTISIIPAETHILPIQNYKKQINKVPIHKPSTRPMLQSPFTTTTPVTINLDNFLTNNKKIYQIFPQQMKDIKIIHQEKIIKTIPRIPQEKKDIKFITQEKNVIKVIPQENKGIKVVPQEQKKNENIISKENKDAKPKSPEIKVETTTNKTQQQVKVNGTGDKDLDNVKDLLDMLDFEHVKVLKKLITQRITQLKTHENKPKS